MQGTDRLNIQSGGLFQDRLRLGAVFSDNAEIIPPGFAGPAFGIFPVEGTELAEGIGGEEDFVRAVIGHEHFRPVHHRGGNETQCMGAEGKLCPFSGDDPTVFILDSVEIIHHGESLGGGNDPCGRELFHKEADIGGMVRLHMLDNEIIGNTAFESLLKIGKPFFTKMLIHRVHDGDFFVQDDIGIIRHAQGDNILALKEIEIVVVDADITDILCYVIHARFAPALFFSGKPSLFYHRSTSGARITPCFGVAKVVQWPPV